MGLILPADIERERLVDDARRQDYLAKALTKELKRLDPYLEIVYIGERVSQVKPEDGAPGVVPGRWHVVRHNPETVDSYFPIMGLNGEFREPTFKLIEDMKEADLWRKGALQDLRDRQIKAADRRAYEKRHILEGKKDEAALAYRAAKRVPGEGGMTKRQWAKK